MVREFGTFCSIVVDIFLNVNVIGDIVSLNNE